MNPELRRVLDHHDGVMTWRGARNALPAHVIRYALSAGHLKLVLPGVLADPERAGTADVRLRAALCCAGPDSALSHLSALAVWGLPADDSGAVHVMTGSERRIRVAGIHAHRRVGFVAAPPDVVVRREFPVVRLERSLVDSWPYLRGDAQRAPVLLAVGSRLTTPQRVRAALADAHNLPGRRLLDRLLTRLDAGCRSELELWGYDRVFTGRGMPPMQRQVPVRLARRVVYLDVYDPETSTNFELDGAKWHAAPTHRERDLRRDAELATTGVQVVRFTHDRLNLEPDRVRREVLAILAARRLSGARPRAQVGQALDVWGHP